MGFLKSFLINVALIIGVFVILFILFPDMMRGVFDLYGAVLGPGILILLLVVAALPKRRRGRR